MQLIRTLLNKQSPSSLHLSAHIPCWKPFFLLLAEALPSLPKANPAASALRVQWGWVASCSSGMGGSKHRHKMVTFGPWQLRNSRDALQWWNLCLYILYLYKEGNCGKGTCPACVHRTSDSSFDISHLLEDFGARCYVFGRVDEGLVSKPARNFFCVQGNFDCKWVRGGNCGEKVKIISKNANCSVFWQSHHFLKEADIFLYTAVFHPIKRSLENCSSILKNII